MKRIFANCWRREAPINNLVTKTIKKVINSTNSATSKYGVYVFKIEVN